MTTRISGSRRAPYSTATWTSPVYAPGFGLTELVASWNADTPAGTWVQVEMTGTTNAATATKWYVMGHLGHYPEFDGVGEAWCSPTSTEMVVEYYGHYPTDVSWVQPQPHDSPSVDYAARYTYDYNYQGAGNWPFNTADAAGIRRVYHRAQFENVWISTSRSGGIAYVVYDAAHPLPANW